MEVDNITFHQDDLIATSFTALDEMRKNEELCDLRITVENHSFLAHRVVLAAGIPYFRSIFAGKGMEEMKEEVTIGGLEPKAFEALIQFAYTGRVHISVENALSLLEVSQFLQLTRVKDVCVEFISKKISMANVVEVRSLAVDFNILKLMECSETYIARNFEEVSKSQPFLSLRGPCLKEIIAKDDLNAPSEEMVYEAVIKWVGHSPSERKDILPDLLTEVRMVCLPIEYLILRVAPEELIKDSAACKELLDKIKNYHLLPKLHQELLNLKTQGRGENSRREFSRREDRKFSNVTGRICAICCSRTTGGKEKQSEKDKKSTKGSAKKRKKDSDSDDEGSDESAEKEDEDHEQDTADDSDDSYEEPEKKKKAKPKKKKETPLKEKKKEKNGAKSAKRKTVGSSEDSDKSYDGESLPEKVKSPPSDDEIKQLVKKILDDADLGEITMKEVIMQVFDAYPDFDLSEKKDYIKATVKSFIS